MNEQPLTAWQMSILEGLSQGEEISNCRDSYFRLWTAGYIVSPVNDRKTCELTPKGWLALAEGREELHN